MNRIDTDGWALIVGGVVALVAAAWFVISIAGVIK